MTPQNEQAKDKPATSAGRPKTQPIAMVKTSVTVISDKDRVMEIQRLEMDRILFWND